MKLQLLLLLVVVFAAVLTVDATSRIRYVNSMPQFGSATVRGLLPVVTLWSNVPGGFLTNYVNVTTKPYVFTTTYATNVTALSFPFFLSTNHYYSLFTYQTQANRVLNNLLTDASASSNPNFAAVRSVNLLQYTFVLDIFNVSNHALITANLSYGDASEYVLVPPGDYQLYWAAAGQLKKRNGGLGNTSDPYLFPGKAYTLWITPTGGFIVQDGVPNPTKKRSIVKPQKVLKTEAKAEAKDSFVDEKNNKFPQLEAVEEVENRNESPESQGSESVRNR